MDDSTKQEILNMLVDEAVEHSVTTYIEYTGETVPKSKDALKQQLVASTLMMFQGYLKGIALGMNTDDYNTEYDSSEIQSLVESERPRIERQVNELLRKAEDSVGSNSTEDISTNVIDSADSSDTKIFDG
jgi:hypothetical protein